MGTFAEMNAVWDAWVPQGHTPPARRVRPKLATPDYKVEIIVTAALTLSGGFHTPRTPRPDIW
jgi:enamine deaminase RidA (YjgF/YER057c/UK114 family)